MLNLLMAPMDVDLTIEKIRPGKGSPPEEGAEPGATRRGRGGADHFSDETSRQYRHLRNLGFVPGTEISIVNEVGGNLIVKIRDSKIAIDREVARRILVRNV